MIKSCLQTFHNHSKHFPSQYQDLFPRTMADSIVPSTKFPLISREQGEVLSFTKIYHLLVSVESVMSRGKWIFSGTTQSLSYSDMIDKQISKLSSKTPNGYNQRYVSCFQALEIGEHENKGSGEERGNGPFQ